ncbi:WD40-repeat-containing domain protein [Cokeromyces recurvatus]|uniref:WD40-repeat-containing domain protein n=1 Tax=Cokeromyces recurvatus TaxID=90255 RepID=UPI0022211665|nr:WD40-repeat-containing domain protein [Cokeromyces recurvatus]KAI7906406.1 WD40-repeat-containing domain protein [Cokeromyces recurvatus]
MAKKKGNKKQNSKKNIPKNKEIEEIEEPVKNEEKYLRIEPASSETQIKDKKLKAKLSQQERNSRDAARAAARAELLLQEETGYLEAEGLEKTFKFRQDQLIPSLDVNTASKIFTLDLPQFGPYAIDYTRNGRHLLIGGHKGHIAAFDWQTGGLHFETHVNETVRDVKWLHNETLLAVAQKKYVYIYDKSGLEIHRLKSHSYVDRLEFLPYHYLLATIGSNGYLKYQDTSTGELVAEKRTKLGPCNTMTQNRYNAVIHLGHQNGTVTLWSPSMPSPLVKMQCHRGPVRAIAVDRGGHYMATSGLDGQLKIWDIRNYGCLQEYYTPRTVASLDISDTGLLGVGFHTHVQIWKDAFTTKQQSPYMSYLEAGSVVQDLKFVPYEDVLGIGHQKGISSIIVPGAGEANFDALEANPFQTKRQRQETEVHTLLDKLQPDMIVLDPTQIGKVNKVTKAEVLKRRQLEEDEKAEGDTSNTTVKERKRMRGRNSALKRLKRKKAKNVIDRRMVK